MERHWRLAVVTGVAAALAAILAGTWGPAAAQVSLDLARKEGQVVWYSSLGLSVAQKVCEAFNKKALGVTCELNRDGSERIFQKVMQEAGANLALADVVHTSDISHFLDMKARGMLARHQPAGADRFPAEFRDPDGQYTVLRSTPYVIAVNTQKVAAAERPRRWKDLLEPRWKGKLVHAHPGYSGVVVTGMTGLLGLFGWDYYAALAKNEPLIVQSAEDPPMKVAGGEAWVGSPASTTSTGRSRRGTRSRSSSPRRARPSSTPRTASWPRPPTPTRPGCSRTSCSRRTPSRSWRTTGCMSPTPTSPTPRASGL